MQDQAFPEDRHGEDAGQGVWQPDAVRPASLSGVTFSMAQALARLLQLVDGAPQPDCSRGACDGSLHAQAASPPMPGPSLF
jgi:hypothetical protein